MNAGPGTGARSVASRADRGDPTYAEINRDVVRTLGPPGPRYFAWMSILGVLLAAGILAWAYQIYVGLGTTGLRVPQMWALYITAFVFWIGIGHAGTLISAILYLFRARWRTSVYRAAETMTVFAVMTAGLFPLIHLGRMWFGFFLLPYPNQRSLWPNFRSPLMWDVFAVTTYLTISVVFFIVGLIPDLAAVRDESDGWRRRVYGVLALGWEGSDRQWRHYRRAYGLLAALATPLVLSVHSVVSWDFAMALVPGWHSTLFAPFFVDGAIFSGFAMVIVLLLPMRRFFALDRYVGARHLDALAKLLLATSLVLTYFYACEAFTAWYSGDRFEKASLFWRVTRTYAWALWLMYFCNCVAPLVLFARSARTDPRVLYAVSLLVLVGMWFERFNIIVASLAHGFYPYTWGIFVPAVTDTAIVVASFAWFLLLFLACVKVLPSLSIVEVKETAPHPMRAASTGRAAGATPDSAE